MSALSDALQSLAEHGTRLRFPKRSRFINEGETGTTVYLILEGSVKVFTSDAEGREFLFGMYGPGQFLGEMALDGQPRSASAEAATDVVCASIPVETFRSRVAQDPDFAMQLILTLIQRSRNTTLFTRRLALETAYQRLADLLRGLAIEQDGRRVLREPMSQSDMAVRIGASRDMVSKIMKTLREGGYIGLENRCISLLKPLPRAW